MKLLFKTSALVFALAVSCSVAVAQVTPGSSPLSIARGGTGANTAAGARAASGLNIDELTSHGDSNYSIASTDRTVATSTTLTAPRTWTLPAASSVNPGQHLYIQDFKGFVSGTNTLTIGRNGSDTINGGTGSQVINTANGGFLFISDGVSNWSAQALGAQATPGAVSSFNTLTGAVTTNVVFQKFLTTGTYTPTTGMLHAIVECIGSGGGGGGVTGSAGGIFVGAGGESGSYSMKRIAATDIVGTATVTIGALGSGGAAGNNSGSAGSDVTVVSNSVTLCAGGFTNTTTIGRGGASAVSGTGDVTAIGSPGDGSFYNSANLTTVAPSGRGGSSALGGGGTSNFCGGGTTAAGAAAGNYGSGGAGACVSNGTGTAAGGNGSAGTVIITEFVNM